MGGGRAGAVASLQRRSSGIHTPGGRSGSTSVLSGDAAGDDARSAVTLSLPSAKAPSASYTLTNGGAFHVLILFWEFVCGLQLKNNMGLGV